MEGQNDKTARIIGSKVYIVSRASSSKRSKTGGLLDANTGQAVTTKYVLTESDPNQEAKLSSYKFRRALLRELAGGLSYILYDLREGISIIIGAILSQSN